MTQALVDAFEKQTGIKVNLRTNDSIVLAQQLLTEGRNTPADVLIAENSPELMLLQKRGEFTNLPQSILQQIPAQFSSPTGAWVGMAARISCLVYNPSRVSPAQLPASVLDLAEPQWAGKVAISPGDSDFVPVVSAVLAAKGENATTTWLQGLRANSHTYQDIEAVLSAVNRGDETVGIINSYYYFRLQLEVGATNMHAQIHYFPRKDPGGVENIAGVGLLAASAHQANAQRFVDFLVSQEGQQVLASGDDFEYPLRPGVVPQRELPPLASVDPTFLGIARLGDDLQAAQLLQKVGLV